MCVCVKLSSCVCRFRSTSQHGIVVMIVVVVVHCTLTHCRSALHPLHHLYTHTHTQSLPIRATSRLSVVSSHRMPRPTRLSSTRPPSCPSTRTSSTKPSSTAREIFRSSWCVQSKRNVLSCRFLHESGYIYQIPIHALSLSDLDNKTQQVHSISPCRDGANTVLSLLSLV